MYKHVSPGHSFINQKYFIQRIMIPIHIIIIYNYFISTSWLCNINFYSTFLCLAIRFPFGSQTVHVLYTLPSHISGIEPPTIYISFDLAA